MLRILKCAALMTMVSGIAMGDQVQIDLSPYANAYWGKLAASPAPSALGNQANDDITFDIPTGANNMWAANWSWARNRWGIDAPALASYSLTIPIGVANVDRVWTLLNTGFGQAAPASYIALTFVGSAGDVYTKNMVDGVDIRSYRNLPAFIDTLSSPDSQQVWSFGDNVMDRQTIVLPDAFKTETLVSFTISGYGGYGYEIPMFTGLTLDTASGTTGPSADAAVPEPASFGLLFTGVGLLGFAKRRRLNRSN